MKQILPLIIMLLFSTVSNAESEESACVKYIKDYGWSKGYSVSAKIVSGSELNSAVGSFSRFESFATYAVVFWDKNEASIFKLPSSSFGTLPIFESEVEDQYGRKWKISRGGSLCY